METTSLQEQAYKIIRKKIIYSDLAPGQRILRTELEESLGIGRTPIREALVQLRKQELIYAVPQSGTYISKINLESAENARFAREQLERKIFAECLTRIDETGEKMLQGIIEKQEKAVETKNARDFFYYDNVFHETCYTIANRKEIWGWLSANSIHLDRFRWLRVATKEMRWEKVIGQHETIMNAIYNKDIDELDFVMTIHLHMMLDEKEFVISRYPDYFVE
ncbi:MAG: GntR family transcriptional regulator [Clostridiales Family XIII bacterium]|jgi:DNA-binding GntR family transcriptional regulator|nr:GntR family transcriptional regulator [Clostridiales Family XIII bacterium]